MVTTTQLFPTSCPAPAITSVSVVVIEHCVRRRVKRGARCHVPSTRHSIAIGENPRLEPQSKRLNNPYRSRGFKALFGTTLFDNASIGSLLPGTTQAHTKPEENSAPADLRRSETLHAALYFLGEALSGAATFPREDEPEAGVGPREPARTERMEEGRVSARTTERAAAGRRRWRGGPRARDDGEGRRTTRLERME
jgi:hypothetical protein